MRKVGIVLMFAMWAVFAGNALAEDTKENGQDIESIALDLIVSVPLSLDTQEDMIAYDAAPAMYWPDLNEVGTMFAVRFTPLQACSLTFIQVVSYNGAGSALIHVWDNDNGSPGNDLITPFTANLTGDISYQRIDLPEHLNIGLEDFHVGVEYTQPPPPYVTGDGVGGMENRSTYKAPDDDLWTALDAYLNIRSFVIYYGDDLIPPTIEHVWQVFGFTHDENHHLSAEIADVSGVASATIHYSPDGSEWSTVDMTNTGGDTWEGAIPTQNEETTVLYYFMAVDASPNSNEAFDPPNAPSDVYVMDIIDGSEIAYDDGSAEAWYIVSNEFDENAFATRMTPNDYPIRVIMARAFVNGATPFTFTINSVNNGIPGDVLPGGEAVTAVREPHGWAIGQWPEGPVITSGSFFLVFHWDPSSPDDPGVGYDQNNVFYRSYWHNTSSGWNMITNGEWMMRSIVASIMVIEYIPGDVNMALGLWPPSVIAGDVTHLVGYFIGGGQAACLLDGFWCSADINGDCMIIGGDVTALVAYFVAGGSITPCPDYEPAWPPLPEEAPAGWPNCDTPVINSKVIPTGSVK